MTIRQASDALRKGMSLGISRPVLGIAERMANGVQFRTMAAPTIEAKPNRKQRRAKKP